MDKESGSLAFNWVCLLAGWVLQGFVVTCSGQEADLVRVQFESPSLAGMSFVLSEEWPLSGTRVPLMVGRVGEDETIEMAWSDDGQLHLLTLECGGAVWSIPVCGESPSGDTLLVPERGGGPFSSRRGAIKNGPNDEPRVATSVDAFMRDLEGLRVRWGVEFQRSRLMDTGHDREHVALVLGGPIDGSGEVSSEVDSIMAVLQTELTLALEQHSKGMPESVQSHLRAVGLSLQIELDPDSLAAFKESWATGPAPRPSDAAALERFKLGASLFARTEAFSDDQLLSHKKALNEADFEALIETTGAWWGGPDADKTAAWFLNRLGGDAFGVKSSGQPFALRQWPSGWTYGLDRLQEHPTYGEEFELWWANEIREPSLPGEWRLFNVREELVHLKDVVGSGPAVWMWLDASAPSTTIQLRVLEQMLASRDGRKLSRNWQWIVADAGSDFEAFEALFKAVADRSGGLSKMPFDMVFAGGDAQWTRAFDVHSLPAMRHHGRDLTPISGRVPLPGPDLMRWLSKGP